MRRSPVQVRQGAFFFCLNMTLFSVRISLCSPHEPFAYKVYHKAIKKQHMLFEYIDFSYFSLFIEKPALTDRFFNRKSCFQTTIIFEKSPPAPPRVWRLVHGTVSRIHSQDRCYCRTLRKKDLRRALRKYRSEGLVWFPFQL